jgi:hypothetical protein
MSIARAWSVLPSWMLALALGLGPLGAEVLAALGHAQVCACCESTEEASCCAGGREEPATPQLVPAEACPCAAVAPASAGVLGIAWRASEARPAARAELERFHRSVELAWVELSGPMSAGESSPAPPHPRGWVALSSRASATRGPERAAALGVLRL